MTVNDLSFTSETQIFSISKEQYLRKTSPLASVKECGEDEFITFVLLITNTSDKIVSYKNAYIVVDNGDKLCWADGQLKPGMTYSFHIFHCNQRYLTPGIHDASFYASGENLYTSRFNIGRNWSKIFKFPTDDDHSQQRPDKRSPYICGWLTNGSDIKYTKYSIDMKADYIPKGTYCCCFNGFFDFPNTKQRKFKKDPSLIYMYSGFQRRADGGTQFILSIWDQIYIDEKGIERTIRAKRTFPEFETDNDSFTGEGTGAHTTLPYDWKPGFWYRMILQCGKSESTGNTTIMLSIKNLQTNELAHVCTYDTGLQNGCFIGSAGIFLENYSTKYACDVRTFEFSKARIFLKSNNQWKNLNETSGLECQYLDNSYGSWEAGADDNNFYMISSGVLGCGRNMKTEKLSVKVKDFGDPYKD